MEVDALMTDEAPAPGGSWPGGAQQQYSRAEAAAGAVVAVPLPVRGTPALQRLQAAMPGCSTADVLLHALATLTRRLLPAEVDTLGLTGLGIGTGYEPGRPFFRHARTPITIAKRVVIRAEPTAAAQSSI